MQHSKTAEYFFFFFNFIQIEWKLWQIVYNFEINSVLIKLATFQSASDFHVYNHHMLPEVGYVVFDKVPSAVFA